MVSSVYSVQSFNCSSAIDKVSPVNTFGKEIFQLPLIFMLVSKLGLVVDVTLSGKEGFSFVNTTKLLCWGDKWIGTCVYPLFWVNLGNERTSPETGSQNEGNRLETLKEGSSIMVSSL